MRAISSETFKRICDHVWRDRDSILRGCGELSGEAALVRAVYWRLCKAGGAMPSGLVSAGHTLDSYQLVVGVALTRFARPHFDASPVLDELVRRYRDEAARRC